VFKLRPRKNFYKKIRKICKQSKSQKIFKIKWRIPKNNNRALSIYMIKEWLKAMFIIKKKQLKLKTFKIEKTINKNPNRLHISSLKFQKELHLYMSTCKLKNY